MWTCVVLLKKTHHLPDKKMAVARVNNLCNVACTVYITLHKHWMWLWVVTDGPHNMKPEVGPVCRGWMHTGRWCSPALCHTHIRPSLAYRQSLLSSLKTTECHFTLQLTLSQHHSSRAWQCHSVSGSLARGTSVLSSTASRQFPMVLGDTVGATCARISSLDAVRTVTAAHTMSWSWCASVLYGRPEPSLRMWECSTGHYWKQQHTTDTLCPTCGAICWYVHPSSAGLQCIPIQMAEVVWQEYEFVSGTWLYPRVNVANTIHIWKLHSYYLNWN